MRLTRDERKELVGELAEAGMSTRVIAPVVGANYKTVQKDVRELVQSGPTAIVGSDGKTYTRTFQPRPEPNVWEEPHPPK